MEPFRFRPLWLSRAATRVVVGKIEPEEKTWLSRTLMAVYHPALLATLNHRWATITVAILVMALTVPVFLSLGSEFMPPLNEGTILYMPITLPGLSVTEATKYLQLQDRIPNLVRARLVTLEPPVPLPVRQAHLALPSRTVAAPAAPSSGSDGRCGASSGTPRVDRPLG